MDECGGPRNSAFDFCVAGTRGVRLKGSHSCLESSEEVFFLIAALVLRGMDASVSWDAAQQQNRRRGIRKLPAPHNVVSDAFVRDKLEPCSEGGAQRAGDLTYGTLCSVRTRL